jgi:hypothetical protein
VARAPEEAIDDESDIVDGNPARMSVHGSV